jgi:hypothetical protein
MCPNGIPLVYIYIYMYIWFQIWRVPGCTVWIGRQKWKQSKLLHWYKKKISFLHSLPNSFPPPPPPPPKTSSREAVTQLTTSQMLLYVQHWYSKFCPHSVLLYFVPDPIIKGDYFCRHDIDFFPKARRSVFTARCELNLHFFYIHVTVHRDMWPCIVTCDRASWQISL